MGWIGGIFREKGSAWGEMRCENRYLPRVETEYLSMWENCS